MSYEPRLFIRKSDLEKHREKIELASWNSANVDDLSIYKELEKALNSDAIVFPEIELLMIHPELTTHNKNVRDLLDDLGVDYVTYD